MGHRRGASRWAQGWIGLSAIVLGGALTLALVEVRADSVSLAELPGTAWLWEEVGGRGEVEDVRSTLGFREDGSGVYGSGGCNRYTGSVSEAKGSLVFGPLASTRRMCAPAVMDQEQRFFEALGRAAAFARRGTLLFVVDAEGVDLLRMTPLEGEA